MVVGTLFYRCCFFVISAYVTLHLTKLLHIMRRDSVVFYFSVFRDRFLGSYTKMLFYVLFLPTGDNVFYLRPCPNDDGTSIMYFIHFSWCRLSQLT